MLLHGYFRSSASFRVRIALNLKKIAHESAYHHLRRNEHQTPEYLALNPQGLLPADSLGRARVRALAYAVACDIHPVDNLRILRYLRTPLGHDEPTVQAWYNHWIAEGFSAIETMLVSSPATGRFCHGDTPTLADLCLVPQVVNSRNFGLDLSPYPTILRIFDACLAMPEFESAMPGNQPDKDPA